MTPNASSGSGPLGIGPTEPLLSVRDLRVRYATGVTAVNGVEFTIEEHGTLAIVGESGAGKTSVARAVAGLLDPGLFTGSVRFRGEELVGMPEEQLRKLRWRRLAYAPQGSPFNPVASLRDQVAEPMRLHLGLRREAAAARAAELAAEVGLDPALLDRYPHQLSGGQLRLALLAMALSCDPEVLILDEPTAGLDVITAGGFVESLLDAIAKRRAALIAITHDLSLAGRLCARTMVLYAAEVAEFGETAMVLGDAAHPYTWALVNAFPLMGTTKELRAIRGAPPDLHRPPAGCRFHPRCPQAEAICERERPPLEEHRRRDISCLLGGIQPLLTLESVTKRYRGPHGRGDAQPAVSGVTLDVRHGEVVGLIGPSGSGKSTLARMAAGALTPDGGRVRVATGGIGRHEVDPVEPPGEDLWLVSESRRRELRRTVQLIFQNPADALSPRMRVLELVREPLDVGTVGEASERDEACRQALGRAGLTPGPELLAAFPHQLSGGQLQRVAIARALVAQPRLLVADEPTSMLDASEQARLVQLLKGLQVDRGMGLLLVSHDIALVAKVADRIAVLDRGLLVELAPSADVCGHPSAPLTRRLIAASATVLGRAASASAAPVAAQVISSD